MSALLTGCGGGGSKPTPPTPPATLTITTTSPLTPGAVSTAYSVAFAASGGTAPFSWSVSSGTVPAGLALSTAGVLSGTPTAAGTSSFSVTVTDSGSPAQTATLAATLVIAPPKLVITTTSPLTAGTVNTAYSTTLTATGGTGAITWAVTTGTLPAGLTLTGNVISGIPTTAGAYSFTITATDSGTPAQTASLAATLTINAPPPIAITTTSPLPEATANAPYQATFAASGGIPPYVWTVATGTLPTGLTLAPTGVLSGTPTTTGSSSFTVNVTDSATTPGTASGAFVLQVVVGALKVTSSSLPSGFVGSPYVAQLAANGGIPPYTWSVTAGTLPAGVVLSPAGLFSGTPGSVTSSSPTFTVTDSAGTTAQAPLPLTINAATGTVPDNYYSFVFAGITPQGSPSTQNGFAINGIIKIASGQVASGFYDENSNTNPPVLKAALTGGTLVLGANGLGQLVLTTPSNTFTFALASPASVSTGGLTPIRMIEYDDATGTGTRGSGVIDPTPASPSAGGIAGPFAFLFSGTDVDQNQQALIGSFQTGGSNTIVSGKADANQVVPVGGVPTREVASFPSVGGTYNVDADGRGLLNLVLGGSTFHFSFYEVSPQEWLVISLDPATLNSPLVSGIAYSQTGAPFSNASLPALSVLEVSGVNTAGASPVPDVSLGLASSDGAGNVTYTFDEFNGALTSGNTSTTAYTVDPTTGRTIATAGINSGPILYLINATSAFYLGVSPSGQSGMIEAQTGSPFTLASFDGNYLGGSLPLVLTSVLNESGLVTADGAGNVNFTTYRSGSTGLAYQNNQVVGTYTVDSTGRGVITTTAPDGLTRIFYVVSPTKIAFLTSDTGGYLGSFQQ